MHLLHRHDLIPAEALRQIADELAPRARRAALYQVLIVVLSFLCVAVVCLIRYCFASTGKGLAPLASMIGVGLLAAVVGGSLMAYQAAKRAHATRVVAAMLKYRRCPHCGYDIHGLPTDPDDGATVCPECGCAWRLQSERDQQVTPP
ncbi:MAG: hypothetical protein ACYSUI_20530 [Planctomycetota bacterium]|jgi:hypothetical protein